jgi:F-type H+-transporting ATPase subunit delta
LAVVHRTYARALYEASRDARSIPAVREQLASFVAATESVPQLHALLVNPKLDARFKRSTLESVLEGADVLLRNFLLLLVEKHRAGEVEEIAREFERIASADEGRLDVELTTAYELSDDEASAILAQIEKASGKHVDATRKVDPALVGGIVLQVGSLRLDASVSGRLTRLRHDLTTRS